MEKTVSVKPPMAESDEGGMMDECPCFSVEGLPGAEDLPPEGEMTIRFKTVDGEVEVQEVLSVKGSAPAEGPGDPREAELDKLAAEETQPA